MGIKTIVLVSLLTLALASFGNAQETEKWYYPSCHNGTFAPLGRSWKLNCGTCTEFEDITVEDYLPTALCIFCSDGTVNGKRYTKEDYLSGASVSDISCESPEHQDQDLVQKTEIKHLD